MSAFDALKLGQKRAQLKAKNSHRKKCLRCPQTFANAGALARHMNSHPTFKRLSPSPAIGQNKEEITQKKRKKGQTKKPPAKAQRSNSKSAAMSRNRYSNMKKYRLVLEFESLKESRPNHFMEDFKVRHPHVSVKSVQKWSSKKFRSSLERDATHPNPRVRNSPQTSERLAQYSTGRFPDQESKLWDCFLERRHVGFVTSGRWFKAKMKKIMRAQKPDDWESFTASNGWLSNFLKRFLITLRAACNTKTKSAAERLPVMKKYHRDTQTVCQPPPRRDLKYGRFPPKSRYASDQVPMEFGGKNHTYEQKGKKLVRIVRPKRRIDTRQATLQLTFNGKGPHVNPGICFRAVPRVLQDGTVDPKMPKSSRLLAERKKYPRSVNVYYQRKGYFDGVTCMAYAKDFKRQAKRGEKIHQMDNLGGQSNPEFRTFMRADADTLIWFVPPGNTDLASAVDAGLGKAVKDGVKNEFEEDFEERCDEWCNGDISASEFRILMVNWLDKAWKQFFAQGGQERVVKTFQRVGFLNAADGSENHLVEVQGIENYSFESSDESSESESEVDTDSGSDESDESKESDESEESEQSDESYMSDVGV